MLFETGFDVMSTQRRQQTTKGLWMSRGKPENLLVIDVEGTDGRERGEQLVRPLSRCASRTASLLP